MAPRELWEEVSCHVLLLWVFSEAPSAAEVTKPGEVDLEQVVKDATWIGFGGLFPCPKSRAGSWCSWWAQAENADDERLARELSEYDDVADSLETRCRESSITIVPLPLFHS